MSLHRIPLTPLTPEAFAPYGTVVELPADTKGAVLSDRFTFWPRVSGFTCDSGEFQIGVSTLYKRPLRTCNLERHYHTQEFMLPLTGDIIIVFAPHKGLDPGEQPDFNKCQAFRITPQQGVVVEVGVWHWTPMPVDADTTIVCSFARGTEQHDVDVKDLPAGEVVEVVL